MYETFIFQGENGSLTQKIFPPIELDKAKNYRLSLVSLDTYNSIPNIIKKKFYYLDGNNNAQEIKIDDGAYEIIDLYELIKQNINDSSFKLIANEHTARVDLYSSYTIDFTPSDSLADVLGFDRRKYNAKELHRSTRGVKILSVETIRVNCNITMSCYVNGALGHTIYQFNVKTPFGYQINERPVVHNFAKVNHSVISEITITLVDQNNKLIDFQGEHINLQLALEEY